MPPRKHRLANDVILLVVLLLLSSLAWPSKGGTNGDRILAITHVAIVDPGSGSLRPDMTVVINGRTITSLGKTDKVRIPRDAFRFDASGKFLIPGLWDMHVHVLAPERDFPMFVANGVLGVRNMAGVAKGAPLAYSRGATFSRPSYPLRAR